MEYINKIINEECTKILSQIEDNIIDMCITSHPYDNLRKYKGYIFPFEKLVMNIVI